MKYFNRMETISAKKLKEHQNERFTHLVKYLYKNVPFYKALFDKNNIKPAAFKSIDDITKLPFTYKNDLRDNYPFGLFAVPMKNILRIHASSGSTGKPTVVGYTRNDIEIFAETVARSLYAAGARPGMKIQNAYGYGLFTGGLGLHYGAEKLNLSVIPISGGMTERQIQLITDFKPDILCCTPSYAQTLADTFQKKGISPKKISLKYAVLGAEPWSEAIRRNVEVGLGVDATNIYGLSEIMGPGVSNEDVDEKKGSYIWEDHYYPEIIDPSTKEPMPEGKIGVLVFTTLTKEGMPLLRYWTNDLCYLFKDKKQGRIFRKMGPILGRTDDMLIIRGVNVYPTQIESVIGKIPELAPYYQLVITRDSFMDDLEVVVEPDFHYNEKHHVDASENIQTNIAEHLLAKIKDLVGITCKITIAKQGSLPRCEIGKINRVVDRRNKI